MDFIVLGRLRVIRDGTEVDLGSRKQRMLLAVLLSRAGETVGTASLVDALWGPVPPLSAVDNTYLYVSRLRRVLGADRLLGGRKHSGYSLEVRAGEVDAQRFSDLAASGEEALRRGDAARAARLLREGLALWRGSPYADFADEPALRDEITRLTERHLLAVEQRANADLELGRSGELVDELAVLVDQHPYRERFAAQLMTALYRTGRQAEALAVYQRTQRTLRDQLGIEPGTELRRLQQAVLAGDLEATPGTPRRSTPRPAQLPADVGDFVGRDAELAWLDEAVGTGSPAVLLMTVSGTAGVGKTALAVHWAHREAHRFPDGQLFVNLRGFGPGLPVDPANALAGFLRALGVPRESVPASVEEAAAVYRSLLAGRRMLVVLDNAADVGQVRPLLPGTDGCVVVVTSRERLSGLVARDGGRGTTLDVLDPTTAVRLLAHIVGPEPVRREAAAAASLAALCGHLPLALRISAANVLDTRDQALGEYVAALGEGHRMTMLAVDRDEASGVRVALDHSYTTLAPYERRALRYLGLVPGPDVTREVLSALLDETEHDTRRLLDRLSRSHLVVSLPGGRYQTHDLVREYARDRALAEDEPAERLVATGRLNRYYVARTDAAARALDPTALRLEPAAGDAVDEEAAREWFEAELPNLVAAVLTTGADETVWTLADALRDHFWKLRNATDAQAVAEAGLAAAESAGDRRAQASMRLSLGLAHAITGRYDEAADVLRQAAHAAHEGSWPPGEAAILSRLGDIHIDMGLLQEAKAFFEQALAINETIGSVGGQAHNRNGLGGVELQLGRPDAAASHYASALVLYQASASTGGEAVARTNLATIHADRGRLTEAADGYRGAIELYRQVGRVDGEVFALIGLAGVERDTGDLGGAMSHVRSAITLLTRTDDSYYRPIALNTLAAVERVRGELDAALTHHKEAVDLSRRTGSRYLEAETLLGLAATHTARGELALAAECATAALTIATEGEFRAQEGQAHLTLSHIRRHEDDSAAADHARQAHTVATETGHRLDEARAWWALSAATTGSESTDARQRAMELLAECGAAETALSPR